MKITFFFLFCLDFVMWFCHNLNKHASFLLNVLTGNQTASFYFQAGIYSAVLSHHFARTKYMYIFSVVHKKNSIFVKTFVFFISLNTYKKLQRITEVKKKRCPEQQSFKFPFSQQEIVQRRGAKATKKLGAGEGACLAGFFHVFYIQCNKRGTPKNRFTY